MSVKIVVHTQAELMTALASVAGGEVIQLAGGTYGDLDINGYAGGYSYSEKVTLAALLPDDPPVFSSLNVRRTENLAFTGITFDYVYADGQPIWHNPFRVTESVGISFENCVFDGDVARGLSQIDDGYAAGRGLQILNSKTVSVSDCDISSFYRGLIIGNSDDVHVRGNDVYNIRSDGMNFYAVQGIVVEQNHIHDFRRAPESDDHADMIQFWTANTTRPSTGIVIRDNILDIGQGDPTQALHMRNEMFDLGLAGDEIRYRDIQIENNVIMNAHRHGINVGEVDGLRIHGNTVVHAGDVTLQSAVTMPIINVAASSTEVTISSNVTAAITGQSPQNDWAMLNNAFVQDQNPLESGWYPDVFVRSSLNGDQGAHRFIVLPDGMIDRLGAGAPSSYLAQHSGAPEAMFHISQSAVGHPQVRFDASVTMGSQPEDTRYIWVFGDGTSAEGREVTHDYKAWGEFDAKLIVRLPDGQVTVAHHNVTVNNPSLLRLDEGGHFIASEAGHEIMLAQKETAPTEGAIQLGGSGVTASVARAVLVPLLQSEAATISFSVAADTAGTNGELFRLHQSLHVDVTTKGELRVQAWSSEGAVANLVATGLNVTDGSLYRVDVTLQEGHLSLSIDGEQLGRVLFDGSFANLGRHDLMFGTPWNTRHFSGEIKAFEVTLGDPLPAKSTLEIDDTDAAAWVSDNNLNSTEVLVGVPAESDTIVHGSYDETPDLNNVAPSIELVRLLGDGSFISGVTDTVLDVAKFVDGDGGVQLGASGITASISRNELAPLFENQNLSISFSLDADQAGTSGEVFRLHNSLYVFVKSNGELLVQAWSSTGQEVSLLSKGLIVNDGKTHEVDIRLEDGVISLFINNQLRSDSPFDGTFANAGRHDLMFGNPWNSRHFNGDLSEFVISLNDLLDYDHFGANVLSLEAPLL